MRVDIRNCLVFLVDGLAGTAALAGAGAPVAGATSLTVGSVATNTPTGIAIPVGAGIAVAGETSPVPHVVTAATPGGTSEAPTVALTISPALGAGTYTATGAVTISNQQLEISVGEGDVKWTSGTKYIYDLDRGHLDDVRQGDDEPLEVAMNFTFVHITSASGEAVTPIEALTQAGAASDWVSYDADQCQPYAVGVLIQNDPNCSQEEWESYLFPLFRSEKREFNIKTANIAISGHCNVTDPICTRPYGSSS
jgi:hypothetical protein